MITSGDIKLKPAQDFSVVTPLAAVVSASMPLHQIDGTGGNGPVYTPINGGSRPSLRLGLRSDAVLNHIRWLNSTFAQLLEESFSKITLRDTGIALVPLAVQGLMGGDDCHGRTVAANKLMMDAVLEPDLRNRLDADTLEFIDSSPSLFLNVWMAASKFMMSSVEGITDSSFVTAVAGNGVSVGIQVAGLPGRWFIASATAPVGSFDVDVPASRAIGAIGDSAVVEGLGLGAMAVRHAPEQLKQFKNYLLDYVHEPLYPLAARRLLHSALLINLVKKAASVQAYTRCRWNRLLKQLRLLMLQRSKLTIHLLTFTKENAG